MNVPGSSSEPGQVHRSVVSGQAVATLQKWTSEVEEWPAGSHVWGHYAEQTETGEAICRTENVSACHEGFRSLVEGDLRELAASVAGVDVVAFKDKVNYKQPGGAGFSPHQDLLAYPGAGEVVSFLVAIDECTMESGCLWVAKGVDELLPTDDRGVVRADVVAALDWSPVELAPGDALCIPGLLPHYSEANKSSAARRVLVSSYAPTSEQYGRNHYYDARRATMEEASAGDGQFRISTLADFEGIEVRTEGSAGTSPSSTVGVCTHG
jgi:Phytanoyl-CoA dioxygenase (PhyH)